MRPIALYRLQFNRNFRLSDARRLVPYLRDLGVTHVYASPLLTSRSDSTHGYDVTDPTRIDPKLGGARSFDAFVRELRRHGMGIILDIVPNHMSATEENAWWRDVLAKGKRSRYADHFDIDWEAGGGRVILPVLSEPGPDRVDGAAIRTYWRDGRERINYRRFFDVTDLVGVRVEDPAVFDSTHELILRLLNEDKIDGVRIDHIDGLRDPAEYLRRLRGRAGDAAYIVVEKILADGERLPRWPVEGTTGYEFLNAVGGVFADPRGVERLGQLHGGKSFDALVYDMKKRVLRDLFPGEVRRLARRGERRALVELTAALPVYRTYIRSMRLGERDRSVLDRAFRRAARRGRVDLTSLRQTLYLRRRSRGDLEFVLRWQQLSGPAMAKGAEDTALYRHNHLVSLNEVGGECRPVTPGELHDVIRRRGRSLNPTSTHDTKRSEDVRARINVLSELADEWAALVREWIHLSPDRSTGHLFYQTLVGAWPLDGGAKPEFQARLQTYMRKAAREAKHRTHWLKPDAVFERELSRYIDAVFAGPALSAFGSFADRIAPLGALNSLAQVVLKAAAPGVPDIYQGNELWDFSLVDPDNRRPVDFAQRRRALAGLRRTEPAEVVGRWRDGQIKLWVTRSALGLRLRLPALFERGAYTPLRATGEAEPNVIAFARRHRDRWAVACVPRLVARRPRSGPFPAGETSWGHAGLSLPRGAPREWRNALTGERLRTPLALAQLFATFPVALLVDGRG